MNTDAEMALTHLGSTCREVQAEGWPWNSEEDFEITLAAQHAASAATILENTQTSGGTLVTAAQEAKSGAETARDAAVTAQHLAEQAAGVLDPTVVFGRLDDLSEDVTAALTTKQDKLGYTPANKAGDTFTGPVTVNGDLITTTGVLRLNATGDRYLFWNGSGYYLGPNAVWHAGNLNPASYAAASTVNTKVESGRLVYAGDIIGFLYGQQMSGGDYAYYEPYAGTVITGIKSPGDGGFGGSRHRYMQLYRPDIGWFTCGYA